MAEAARRTDGVMVGLAALGPACLAGAHVADVADAAHDAGVARVLGLDAHAWRALDVALGSLFALVPVGTLAARAALGGALAAGGAGAGGLGRAPRVRA